MTTEFWRAKIIAENPDLFFEVRQLDSQETFVGTSSKRRLGNPVDASSERSAALKPSLQLSIGAWGPSLGTSPQSSVSPNPRLSSSVLPRFGSGSYSAGASPRSSANVGLGLPIDPRFGSLGIPVGTIFESRAKLRQSGAHSRTFAGISGCRLGAFSVVVSGGYADDRDDGDFIVYTGTGGQADSFGGSNHEQIADQTFSHKDNGALLMSSRTQIPVRVFRGYAAKSIFAPSEGYRFDGMYFVEQASLEKGIHGYHVCKFHLRRVPGQPPFL